MLEVISSICSRFPSCQLRLYGNVYTLPSNHDVAIKQLAAKFPALFTKATTCSFMSDGVGGVNTSVLETGIMNSVN